MKEIIYLVSENCKILSHYGLDHQVSKCQEELSELHEVLNLRKVGHIDKPSTISEIADVLNMGLQMALAHGLDDVHKEMKRKLKRERDRIEQKAKRK